MRLQILSVRHVTVAATRATHKYNKTACQYFCQHGVSKTSWLKIKSKQQKSVGTRSLILKIPLSGQQSPQDRTSSALGHLGHSKMACIACNSHGFLRHSDAESAPLKIYLVQNQHLSKFGPGTSVSRLTIVQNNFLPSHWGSAVYLFSILEVQ